MTTVVLVIHVLIAVALVGVVLLQRSEGGGLGMGGGGNFGGMMSGRGSGNLLTRTTAILAAGFMVTSLTLAFLAGHGRNSSSILDLPAAGPAAPIGGAGVPAAPAAPPAPAAPAEPSAPVAN
jgi:preprotein translocase subunit SecG